MENDNKLTADEILGNVFDPIVQDCQTPLQDLQLAITLNPSVDKIILAMEQYADQQSTDLLKQIDELKKDLLHYAINVCPEKDAEYERLKQQNEYLSQVIESQKDTTDKILKKYDELWELSQTMSCRLEDNIYYHEGGKSEDLPTIMRLSQEILNKYNQIK